MFETKQIYKLMQMFSLSQIKMFHEGFELMYEFFRSNTAQWPQATA